MRRHRFRASTWRPVANGRGIDTCHGYLRVPRGVSDAPAGRLESAYRGSRTSASYAKPAHAPVPLAAKSIQSKPYTLISSPFCSLLCGSAPEGAKIVYRRTRYRDKTPPSRRADAYLAFIVCVSVAVLACQRSVETPLPPGKPQQVARGIDAPTINAARVETAAVSGDTADAPRSGNMIDIDLLRAISLLELGRGINPHSARASVLAIPGIRSVTWSDDASVLVRTDGAQ